MDGWNFDPNSLLNSLSSSNKSNSTSSNRLDATTWDGNLALLSNFGGVEYGGGVAGHSKQSTTSGAGEAAFDNRHYSLSPASDTGMYQARRSAATVSESTSVNSGGFKSGPASVASRAANLPRSDGTPQSAVESQLHPLAIQSSATCPPHGNASSVVESISGSNAALSHPYEHVSTDEPASSGYYGLDGIDSVAIASLAASFQNPHTTNAQKPAQTQPAHYQHKQQSDVADSQGGQVQFSHSQSIPAPTRPSHGGGKITGLSQPGSGSAATKGRSPSAPPGPPGSNPPPFYLFDAPVELRMNFMQNQKRLGLPIQDDPNSYHFGEVVKGFHPQQLMNQQQLNSMLANGMQTAGNQIPNRPVKLIDARHGKPKSNSLSGRVKNEREQKRAQKITELIERIRLEMENGGWSIELRSKFHTLSKCAEYVKHMIKETKDKEESIKKLTSDLEVKKRIFEEDKSAQESRSDPESVMSALTSDTNNSLRNARMKTCAPPTKKQKIKGDAHDSSTKRAPHMNSSQNMSSIATNEDSSGGGEDRGSGDSGAGSGGPSAQGFSVDKTDITGVSELTESNRASSSSNSGSGDGSGKTQSLSQDPASGDVEIGQTSGNSISSDAAVASQRSTHESRNLKEHKHNHRDVVVHHAKRAHRKRSSGAKSSKDQYGGIDYEEIFSMSNVPQLIAAASGKVVAWNQCYLQATGVRRTDAEKMTIFSLVRQGKLSKFFEFVAQVLKRQEESSESESQDIPAGENDMKTGSADDARVVQRKKSVETFQCIEFPGMRKRREANEIEESDGKLFMTVTFMGEEEDSRKRFFHCIFTNRPGQDGSPGILSSELLASMRNPQERPQKKPKRHHHSKSSKQRSRSNGESATTHAEEDVPSAISQPLGGEIRYQEKGDDLEETVT